MDAFPAIVTAFKFADFCIRLNDVPLENRVFCQLIEQVRTDLAETSRLLQKPCVVEHLESDLERKEFIKGVLARVKHALNDIGEYVETVRLAEERKGGTKLIHRFQWVVGHQAKLATRERALDISHKTLLTVMSEIRMMELAPALFPFDNSAQDHDLGDVADEIQMSLTMRYRSRHLKSKFILIDLQEHESNKEDKGQIDRSLPYLDFTSPPTSDSAHLPEVEKLNQSPMEDEPVAKYLADMSDLVADTILEKKIPFQIENESSFSNYNQPLLDSPPRSSLESNDDLAVVSRVLVSKAVSDTIALSSPIRGALDKCCSQPTIEESTDVTESPQLEIKYGNITEKASSNDISSGSKLMKAQEERRRRRARQELAFGS